MTPRPPEAPRGGSTAKLSPSKPSAPKGSPAKPAPGKAPASGPPSLGRRALIIKWGLLSVVTGIAVALCMWTTYLAEQRLVLGEVDKILPFLWLQRSANSGVAFGLLGGKLAVILAANAVAILVVLFYVFMERRAVLAGIAGGMVIGGSLGNIVQRFTGDGHVTDFLKFPYWPNFNVPDVFIVLGIVCVFLGLLVEGVRVYRAGNKTSTAR
jgi:lipoprotein signal peptidase